MATDDHTAATPQPYWEIYITCNCQELLDLLRENNHVYLAARANAFPLEFTAELTAAQLDRLSPNHLVYSFGVVTDSEDDVKNIEIALNHFQTAREKNASAKLFLSSLEAYKNFPQLVEEITAFLIFDLKSSLSR